MHARIRNWSEVEARLPDNIEPMRLVYAAAHIVMRDSYAAVDHAADQPGIPNEIAPHIDWEATMAFRRHLASHGFGIAEAMDTAQRFEIGWDIARELIERCGRLDLPHGFVAGAGVDHLEAIYDRGDLINGVLHQCDVIHQAGGIPIVLSMPWLSLNDCPAEEYVEVYGAIIREAPCELLIHWLGPMFLAALEGYFPGDSFERVMELDPATVRGAKISMLDDELEIRLRRSMLERDQVMLTGDDFHFGELMKGDGAAPTRSTTLHGRPVPLGDFSHGLLGIFDGIAEPAGIALRALAAGQPDDYDEIMTACEALGRKIFEEPTQHYKAGLALLAWLNGHQPNAMLVNHLHRARDLGHYTEVLQLAGAAGALSNPTSAMVRFAAWRRSAFPA